MKEITFVTGNPNKAKHASRLLDFPVVNHDVDLPEIQSLDLQEVVADKLKRAFEIIQMPVIVEDIALEFSELKRIPGPFIKFFAQELGLEKLAQMLDGKSRKAIAKCVIGFTDGQHTEFFKGEQHGTIADFPRGKDGFGWDKIFVSDKFPDKTNAELNETEYAEYFTSIRRFDLLRSFLKSLNKCDEMEKISR